MVSDRVTAALARMGADEGAEGHAQARARRISLSPSQVAGSSLAASCSALVASFLGVAGTIGGAAIGSVVATTGTALYGPALRHGGKRIVKRLGPNTVVVAEPKPQAATATATWTQTELAITPEAEVGAIAGGPSAAPSQPRRKTGYRKPLVLAVAMLAVFGAAITVGLLAGGPIRQAGTGYNFTRPQTVTRQQSATASSGPTASTSTAASASASAAPSGTAPSSGSAATSQGAASQGATG